MPDRYGVRISGPHHGGGHGGGHHGGSHHVRRGYDDGYYPVAAEPDTASIYQARNECVATADLAAEIAATLRIRGWVDRVYTSTSGKKVAVLCPPGVQPTASVSGLQPGRMVISEIGRLDHLGDLRLSAAQAITVPVQVIDLAGKPYPGLTVKAINLNGDGVTGTTDSTGHVSLSVGVNDPTEMVSVVAKFPQGDQVKIYESARDAGMILQFQGVSIAAAWITPVEGGLAALAALLGILGAATKTPILYLGAGGAALTAAAARIARV